jgi:hypothetical protein
MADNKSKSDFLLRLPPLDHVSIRRVCDSLADWSHTPAPPRHCFDAALIHPKDEVTGKLSGGPSGEVFGNGWAEAKYLRPLLEYAFNGTCFHNNGSRKVFVDIGSNIGLCETSLTQTRRCPSALTLTTRLISRC